MQYRSSTSSFLLSLELNKDAQPEQHLQQPLVIVPRGVGLPIFLSLQDIDAISALREQAAEAGLWPRAVVPKTPLPNEGSDEVLDGANVNSKKYPKAVAASKREDWRLDVAPAGCGGLVSVSIVGPDTTTKVSLTDVAARFASRQLLRAIVDAQKVQAREQEKEQEKKQENGND